MENKQKSILGKSNQSLKIQSVLDKIIFQDTGLGGKRNYVCLLFIVYFSQICKLTFMNWFQKTPENV